MNWCTDWLACIALPFLERCHKHMKAWPQLLPVCIWGFQQKWAAAAQRNGQTVLEYTAIHTWVHCFSSVFFNLHRSEDINSFRTSLSQLHKKKSFQSSTGTITKLKSGCDWLEMMHHTKRRFRTACSKTWSRKRNYHTAGEGCQRNWGGKPVVTFKELIHLIFVHLRFMPFWNI